jgi:hemerythrin-like domain-containing protein
MIEKGIPKEGGPIGVMLEEHEIGRSAVREMSEGISLMEKGEVAGRERFVNGAVKYTELLKDHIYKEDHILYEMARTVFDSNDMDKLAEAFDRVEREDIGEGVHEKYLDIARYLAKKYLDEDIHHHHH